MKNSWGCAWGDSGYFKQSWEFNSESYFQGIDIDSNNTFVNDIPQDEEPECVIPEDSNNADKCKQYNEFGDCAMCNSG
jgi:aminopeptidase C